MTNKLMVYGICKIGYSHDLADFGATYIGDAMIPGAVLHQIGHGVGLRFSENPLEIVYGEVFEVPETLWARLDWLESNGKFYQRRITTVVVEDARDGLKEIECWVYEHIYFSDEGYKHLPIIEDGRFERPSKEAVIDRPDEASRDRGADTAGLAVNTD